MTVKYSTQRLRIICILFLLYFICSCDSWQNDQLAEKRFHKTVYFCTQFLDNDKIIFHYRSQISQNSVFIYELSSQKVYRPKEISNNEYPCKPSFSRDGKKITFASEKDGNSNIFLMNVDGSGLRQLTNSLDSYNRGKEGNFKVETNAGPSFSPDGKRILFKRAHTLRVRNYPPHGFSIGPIWWDVFEVEIVTGKEYKLTDIESHLMSDPFYFSDGKRFVFHGDKGQPHNEVGVFIANNSNNSLEKVKTGGWWIPGPHISWNDKIIFRNDTKGYGHYDLFIYDAGKVKQLTMIQSDILELSISPNGKRALFTILNMEEENNSIWIINTDGTGLTRINIPLEQLVKRVK